MAKRTKENTLSIGWSKKENDLVFSYPFGSQTKSDGALLWVRMGCPIYDYQSNQLHPLFKELEERGYDLSTLKFSICKKEDHPRWKATTIKAAEKAEQLEQDKVKESLDHLYEDERAAWDFLEETNSNDIEDK